MHISCQTYLPTPSSGGSSSSNSRKTLRAMAERSEEAHHVAEFHTGRGDWRWSLADPVSIGDTRTTWVVKRSLTSPFFLFSFFLSFLHSKLFILPAFLCTWMRWSATERERKRVSAESSVTSWPLHVKQYVVRCQWLKQRYARLHVCTVPTNSLKRLVRFSFASIVLHKEAVGHWKKHAL